jgi:hypothetical protein
MKVVEGPFQKASVEIVHMGIFLSSPPKSFSPRAALSNAVNMVK